MIIDSLFANSKDKAVPIKQLRETMSLVEDIVDLLDEKAILGLSGGQESDIDKVIQQIFKETFDIVTTQNKILDSTSFTYVSGLTESVEETLRCKLLNYFISSLLPDFILGWHNLEWSNLLQIYRLLGVLAARDHGKSISGETSVRMGDGTIKLAGEIRIGDLLMGPDSVSRKVIGAYRGRDKMYRVNQSRGNSYTVNSRHILSLYRKWRTPDGRVNPSSRVPELIDVEIKDFINSPRDFKNLHKGYKVCLSLPYKKIYLDPYYLGLWLGDGTQSIPQEISTVDKKIVGYLTTYGGELGLDLKTREDQCARYLSGTRGRKNPINSLFKKYDLTSEKYIPEDFILNSVEVRMGVLAGLADSDGSVEDNQLIITQSVKHSRLIDDIENLCYTLGLHCVRKSEWSSFTKSGRKFESIRLKICGEKLLDLPVLLDRKRIKDTELSNSMFRRPKVYTGDSVNYDISNVSTLDIEELEEGEYISIAVDGDNRFVLGDGTVTHNSYHFSYAYPLWQMYRYQPIKENQKLMLNYESNKSRDLSMAREGMLITNEYGLARHLMDIIQTEIDSNDILKERLKPIGRESTWGSDHIECKNGSSLVIKSANSKIRGYHPTWIVLDDFLNDSSIYSQDQRDKYWNIFSGVVLPALSPSGQLIAVGTPFFEKDLYYRLRQTNIFKMFEYPAIFPDGKLLFPERHSYKSLMEKKEVLGSLIFSREILVKPISDDSTIFPYSILNKAIKGGEDREIISNIDNINRDDYLKIAVGCDFAISGNVGSDYSVFTVGGLDKFNKIHIFNCWRRQGANYSEQMAVLKKIDRDFSPDIMFVENNNFQEIFVQMMKDENLPVVGKTTGANKKSLYLGVPRMAVFFETNKMRFPYKSKKAKAMTDLYFSELNSISFIQQTGKLESLTQHDDTSMSLWNLCRALLGDKMEFSFSYL